MGELAVGMGANVLVNIIVNKANLVVNNVVAGK